MMSQPQKNVWKPKSRTMSGVTFWQMSPNGIPVDVQERIMRGWSKPAKKSKGRKIDAAKVNDTLGASILTNKDSIVDAAKVNDTSGANTPPSKQPQPMKKPDSQLKITKWLEKRKKINQIKQQPKQMVKKLKQTTLTQWQEPLFRPLKITNKKTMKLGIDRVIKIKQKGKSQIQQRKYRFRHPNELKKPKTAKKWCITCRTHEVSGRELVCVLCKRKKLGRVCSNKPQTEPPMVWETKAAALRRVLY